MRQELKSYADEAFDIIKYASEEIGSRLPGTEEEKKFADYMGGKLEEIGIKPVKEKFLVAPRATVGGIPYAGWVGIIGGLLMYFQQLYILVAVMCIATWVWLVCSVFLYKTWFDFAFPQKASQNVYGELLPADKNYKYTIILSGHTDTSWNWKHSMLNPNLAFVKMGVGILAFLFVTVSSIVLFAFQCVARYGTMDFAQVSAINDFTFALWILIPTFVVPGCFFITMWADGRKATASPGAMDNASGIALAYEITKYFNDNPDKMPKNCRIVDFNCGCEEAGLRGAMAFVKRHKDDGMLDNCYNINIDSVADKDFFEVIRGDAWQGSKFDSDLIQMFTESMKEAGIENPGNIVNPVGGCDSTPLTKAGVKSVTFAAQNPVITNYYHTFNDQADRFSVDVVHMGMDVILRVIDKIDAKESGK